MELFECLVAADFDDAADFLFGELFIQSGRPAGQVNRNDIQAGKRSGRYSAAASCGPGGRTGEWGLLTAFRPFLLRMCSIFRNQHFQGTGLARVTPDQSFPLQRPHHLIGSTAAETHMAAAISDSAGGHPCRFVVCG